MDKADRIGLTIIIIIMTFWLAATQKIETLRKDVKECRADIEELYLRLEK